MNTRLLFLLPALLLVAPLGLVAQRTADYVPGDVSFAFSLHPEHLTDKVNFREIQQMGFYQMAMDQITMGAPEHIQAQLADAMMDGDAIGINDNADVYIFGKITPEVDYYAMVVGLSDPMKWSDFILSAAPPGETPEVKAGYSYFHPDDEMTIAWNPQVMVIAGSNVKDSWGMYDDDYGWEDVDEYEWEETEPVYDEAIEMDEPIEGEPFYEEEIIDEEMIEEEIVVEEVPWDEELEEDDYTDYADDWIDRQIEETLNWTDQIMQRSFGLPLRSTSKYSKAYDADTDAFFWMDYNMITNMAGGQNPYGTMGMISGMFMGLYDGMHLGTGLNFDDGQINMDMDVFGNQQMLDLWSDMSDSKYDKDLLQYIDAENLLGYFTLNFNMEGLGEGLKEMMYPMISQIPEMGEAGVALLDVLGIVVDDEALYNLFTGDAVFALTGMTEFTQTITTYEYDENFNATEVEREVSEMFPEFALLLSYGNEEHVRRLIRLVETTGISQNMGSFYSMNIPDMPGEYYLAMHDDILFFTNDSELITTNLSSGIAKDRRLSKDHKKMWKKSSSAYYWNIPNTLDQLETWFGVSPFGPSPAQMFFNMGRDELESVTVSAARKVDDAYRSRISIQLADEETNAFYKVMELINEMVMDMMDGDSRS